MVDYVASAMTAIRAFAGNREAMDALKKEGGSAREQFARAALMASATLGKAGLDAVKAGFDKQDKSVRDKAKGAVSETLGIIRYVMDGNALPKTDKTPAIERLSDFMRTDVALSGFVKVWREANNAAKGEASVSEKADAEAIGAGILALELGGYANVPDILSDGGYTVTTKDGDKFVKIDDIRAEGAKRLDKEAKAAKAEADKRDRAAFRADVVRFLRGCTPDELTAIMDDVTVTHEEIREAA
jgi:hypothetical protein